MDKIIFGVCIFAFGFLMGLDVSDAQAKRETDAQKQERLENNRAVRRATEARYASCLRSCL
jgi:hypothetical protein